MYFDQNLLYFYILLELMVQAGKIMLLILFLLSSIMFQII